MKVEKSSELLFLSLSLKKNEEDEWEWRGKIGEKEIVGETIEECVKRILKETNAIEFELVPSKIAYNQIETYHLILKTEK